MARENKLIEPSVVFAGETIALRPEASMSVAPVQLQRKPLKVQDKREIERIELDTQKIHAATGYVMAGIELMEAIDKGQHVAVTLATNRAWQEAERIRAENEAQAERARGETAALAERVTQTGLRANLAEAQQRLDRAQNPPPPMTEDEKRSWTIRRMIHERLEDQFTEQEAWRVGRELIADIRRDAGGKSTPDVERRVLNVEDVIRDMLGDL